jgi:hypothetical protein
MSTRIPRCFPTMAVLTLAVCAFHTGAVQAAPACGDYGTSVIFAESPVEAAKQALEEEKLVFVLHVSGNFETSAFT